MSKTFTCYIHKPGVLTPELRVVACPSEDSLKDTILLQMRTWPQFELVEVFDEADKPVYRFALNENMSH